VQRKADIRVRARVGRQSGGGKKKRRDEAGAQERGMKANRENTHQVRTPNWCQTRKARWYSKRDPKVVRCGKVEKTTPERDLWLGHQGEKKSRKNPIGSREKRAEQREALHRAERSGRKKESFAASTLGSIPKKRGGADSRLRSLSASGGGKPAGGP